MKRRRFLAATTTATSLGLAGCSGGDNGNDVESGDVVETIVIEGREFDPQKLDIEVGDAVEWENNGDERSEIRHTEDVGENWDVEIDMDSGETGRYQFDTPGIFAYHDRHLTSYQTCGAIAVGEDGVDDIPTLNCENP